MEVTHLGQWVVFFIVMVWTIQPSCYSAQRTLSTLAGTDSIYPCLLRSSGAQLVHIRCALVSGDASLEPLSQFSPCEIIRTTRGLKKEGKKKEITFFYGILAIRGWDSDRWRWVKGYRFLKYTT